MSRAAAPVRSVLLVSGSLRAGSTNTALLATAAAVAPAGISATLFGGMGALPHFNPDDDAEGATLDPAVVALRTALDAADAVLLCVPEYAGALPGSLKNLLEWTVGGGQLSGKPVAWVNAAGPAAPNAGADAHASLAKVLAWVGADLVGDACARIPLERSAVGPDGLLTDASVREGLVTALRRLTSSA